MVYTALIGDYDQLAPVIFPSDVSFVVFTDNAALSVEGWTTRSVCDWTEVLPDMPNWMINRIIKVHPHVFLPTFHESLYVDCNIALLRDPAPLFDRYLSSADLAIPLHMDRSDIREELEECLRAGKLDKSSYNTIASRVRYYEDINLPMGPLTENNVMLRRSCPEVNLAMEAWWREICQGVKRDQIALPYALHGAKVKFAPVREGPRVSAKYMTIRPHWPSDRPRNLRYYARTISALRHRSIFHMVVARTLDILVVVHSLIKRETP
ncbi:glycosyltransferase domain-containing protein [Cereibacter changlensis]|uniref:glycosyltransferase domain-containing protein n=1 Tax=Cereibacter changlensis TaxID=402884 RepID=UPI0014760DAB|nr:glycosyltransferase domain-containing protein [Cereibacter changlensis]